MRRHERRVEAYLDAVAGFRAIRTAIAQDGATPARLAALAEARLEAARAYGRLTGREAWLAKRALTSEAI